MKFIKTAFKGLFVIEPELYEDNRGNFYRVFCQNELKQVGYNNAIVQINQSFNKKKGTIRGMHFQYPPMAEIKIVRCIAGSIFDVAIDLRTKSTTYLQWYSEILSAENKKMICIPEGFAHGFQTLKDNTEIVYFLTEFYNPDLEGAVRYDDPKFKISWPLEPRIISERDKNHPFINENFNGISLLS